MRLLDAKYVVVGSMYMDTIGCMYADVGCMYMERLGAQSAVVGCKVCGCWVHA